MVICARLGRSYVCWNKNELKTLIHSQIQCSVTLFAKLSSSSAGLGKVQVTFPGRLDEVQVTLKDDSSGKPAAGPGGLIVITPFCRP